MAATLPARCRSAPSRTAPNSAGPTALPPVVRLPPGRRLAQGVSRTAPSAPRRPAASRRRPAGSRAPPSSAATTRSPRPSARAAPASHRGRDHGVVVVPDLGREQLDPRIDRDRQLGQWRIRTTSPTAAGRTGGRPVATRLATAAVIPGGASDDADRRPESRVDRPPDREERDPDDDQERGEDEVEPPHRAGAARRRVGPAGSPAASERRDDGHAAASGHQATPRMAYSPIAAKTHEPQEHRPAGRGPARDEQPDDGEPPTRRTGRPPGRPATSAATR